MSFKKVNSLTFSITASLTILLLTTVFIFLLYFKPSFFSSFLVDGLI